MLVSKQARVLPGLYVRIIIRQEAVTRKDGGWSLFGLAARLFQQAGSLLRQPQSGSAGSSESSVYGTVDRRDQLGRSRHRRRHGAATVLPLLAWIHPVRIRRRHRL